MLINPFPKILHMKGLLLLIIIFSILLPSVTAIDQVIINSQDWKDIYTGMLYAQLVGKDAHYVAEKTQGLQLINEVIDKDQKNILLIESENPVAIGYGSYLEKAGFTVKKYLSVDPYQTNLEFAQKAVSEKNIHSFMVIDAKLGYSAVSIAPYAVLRNASVLFATAENSNQITKLLAEKGKEIVWYGNLDRKVEEELLPLHPEIIHNDDEYQDNVEIVSRFLESQPTKQIIFTSGEVLEKSFFNAEFPVLLIGTDLIPGQTLDFLQDSSITTAVVIGYDLFSNAKKIKDETGIKVLLKYGQGRNSELYALDIFPLPRYNLQIDIGSIRYNTINKNLEVTYRNSGNAVALVQALAHQISGDGVKITEVGDEKPILLNPGDEVTILYSTDLTEYQNTELTVESTVMFGPSTASLSRLFSKKDIPVEIVSVEDSSEISIEKAEYDVQRKKFEITIRNQGEKEAYADVDLLDLMIGGRKTTLGAKSQKISPGKAGIFTVNADLEKSDLEQNRKITVRARYGERQGILVKAVIKEFDLRVAENPYKPFLLVGLIILFLLLLLKIKQRKKRKPWL